MESNKTPQEYHIIFPQITVVPNDDLLWLRK